MNCRAKEIRPVACPDPYDASPGKSGATAGRRGYLFVPPGLNMARNACPVKCRPAGSGRPQAQGERSLGAAGRVILVPAGEAGHALGHRGGGTPVDPARQPVAVGVGCLLYTSDAADDVIDV